MPAPPLKCKSVTNYNWQERDRIKWYRGVLKSKTEPKPEAPLVFEICGRTTLCTVLWQDGTLEESIARSGPPAGHVFGCD